MSRIGLVVILVLLPASVYALLKIENETAPVYAWLPEYRQERQQYEEFKERFGDDQFVLASWPGLEQEDPLIDKFVESVRADHPQLGELISDAISTKTVRDRLGYLSDRQFRQRFARILVGRDGLAVITLTVSEDGLKNPADTVQFLRDTARKLGLEELKLVGSVCETVAVDQASESSLRVLVAPSCLLGGFVAWFMLQRVRQAILVFSLATLGQFFSIASMYYLGGKFSAFLIVLPTLVFMLSLSSVVHLANYWIGASKRESRQALARQKCGARAFRDGVSPCVLASLTTMVGMGSLVASSLIPIQTFGFFAALGLGVSTIVVLIAFPVLSDWLLQRRTTLAERTITDGRRSFFHRVVTRRRNWLALCITKNANWFVGGSVVALVFALIGLFQLGSTTKFEDMFDSKSEQLSEMAWFDQNLGPTVPIEILLDFDYSAIQQSDAKLANVVLPILQKVHRAGHEIKATGGILSALNFVGTIPRDSSLRSTAKRSVINTQFESQLENLEAKGLLSIDKDRSVFRVTTFVPVFGNENYGDLTDEISRAVMTEVSVGNVEYLDSIVVTGLTPVIYEAQQMLLGDLTQSFALAFLLISPVLAILLRTLRGGIAAMYPNLLPVICVFGAMGWVGIDIDMAGMMTASVALGIAVDDTLHFLHWFKHALHVGKSRERAAWFATKKCSLAMIQTTLICSFAMLPFFFSDFLPTAKFAVLMICMLFGAIIADLVLLPAVLVSPLGKYIICHPSKEKPHDTVAASAIS